MAKASVFLAGELDELKSPSDLVASEGVSFPAFLPHGIQSAFFGNQVQCSKVINDAYFCAKPSGSSKPRVELPQEYAKSFAGQVAVLGELSKQSTVLLGQASRLIGQTKHHLEQVGHELEAGLVTGNRNPRNFAMRSLASDAAKEADAANLETKRAKKLSSLAVANATSGPLHEAEHQGKGLITEPLIASMEAVRGARTIVTPWSRHAAHPPGLYCQRVCENRPGHFLT